MKNIKVFLGGFTNYANAQNLNCRALAIHLDKQNFEIYTLSLAGGQLSSVKKEADVKVFNCFKPARLSVYVGFLWGIWHCDIAYLPKTELWRFNRFLLRLFNKKSFSTIEGIMDDTAKKTVLAGFGSFDHYVESRSFFSKQYSITEFMRVYNYEKNGIKTDHKILYLGVDAGHFKTPDLKNGLHKVLMIGNDLVRKGVYDYLQIAASFPGITFYIAGSGNGKIDVDAEINKRHLKNVFYKGLVTSAQLKELLKEVDLHILPSRSEGFPKVTLETAAAGIPSIVYDDYGAKEFITHAVNGWVVNTVEEMIAVVKNLTHNTASLKGISEEAIKLAISFDWKLRVKDWEEVIIQLNESKLTRV